MTHTTAIASRRTWLSRLLRAAVMAPPALSVVLVDNVDATKKGRNTIASIQDRLQVQQDICETIGGGTLGTTTLPSGNKVTRCEGGANDGTYCKHTRSGTTCRCNNTGRAGSCILG